MTTHTDICIVGGGIAGLIAALNMQKELPDRKIVVVEPATPTKRSDYKVGEALIEWSVAGLQRLDLLDYLVQNHPDKYGLSFHMRKSDAPAELYGDYYHLWGAEFSSSGGGLVANFPRSFFIDRVKFETDVTIIAKERGIEFIHAAASSIDLSDEEMHVVRYSPAGSQVEHELRCHWVVDCAGRRFFIARREKILQRKIAELDTGAAWVRVKDFDTSILKRFGMDPSELGRINYLSTSHWIGRGHWLWQIPLCEEQRFLSIGVIYHYEHHAEMNSEAEFLTWLETNHRWLAELIRSGSVVDFQCRHHLAYRVSKFVDAKRRWAVCGDAAVFMDAMFSQGIALACTAAETAAAVAKEWFAERKAAADVVADSGNEVLAAISDLVEEQFRVHRKILHDPTAMSINTSHTYDMYFGNILPAFLARAHADPVAAKELLPALKQRLSYSRAVNDITVAVATHKKETRRGGEVIYELHGTNLGLYFSPFPHSRYFPDNHCDRLTLDDAKRTQWFGRRLAPFLVGQLCAAHCGLGLLTIRHFELSWMFILGFLAGLCRATAWLVKCLPVLGRRWAFSPNTRLVFHHKGGLPSSQLVEPGLSGPQFDVRKGLRINPMKLCLIPTLQPTDGPI